MLPEYPAKPHLWATMLRMVSEWAVFGAKGLPHPRLKDLGKAARFLRPAMMFQLSMMRDLLKESLKRCPEDFSPPTVFSLRRIARDIDRHVVLHNDYDGSKPFIEACMQELVDLKVPRAIDAYFAAQSTVEKPDMQEMLRRLLAGVNATPRKPKREGEVELHRQIVDAVEAELPKWGKVTAAYRAVGREFGKDEKTVSRIYLKSKRKSGDE